MLRSKYTMIRDTPSTYHINFPSFKNASIAPISTCALGTDIDPIRAFVTMLMFYCIFISEPFQSVRYINGERLILSTFPNVTCSG